MKSGECDIHVLQITDLHLMSRPEATLLGVDTSDSCAAVLQQALQQQRPDLLIISGDIAQEAVQASYLRMQSLLRKFYDGKFLTLPGNHDLIQPMSESGLEMCNFQQGNWAVILLDTHVEHRIAGHVDDDDLNRLSQSLLACDASYVLVVGHHPLHDTGTPWLDQQRIDNGEDLLQQLKSDPRVRAYVFGHIHQQYDGFSDPVQLLGTPSTCFQFATGSQKFSLSQEAPGYRQLILKPEGCIETSVRRVRKYDLNIDWRDGAY